MTIRILIACLVCAGATTAHADSSLWTKVTAEYAPRDDVELELDQHLRFDEGATRLTAVMPELGVSYQLGDWLKLGGGYRLAYKRYGKLATFSARHRFHIDARVRHAYRGFRLQLRTRWQELRRPSGFRQVWRNRASIRWRASDWLRPFAAAELFHEVGGGSGVSLRTRRYTGGASIRQRRNDLEAFLRVEEDAANAAAPTAFIVGVALSRALN